MIEIDYKKVVFVLIERGFTDQETVRKIVGELAVADSLDESRNSEFWDEAKRLCLKLNERVIANGFKPFAVNKTSVGAMEKLLRLDKREVKAVEDMIEWCTADDFWHGNIRSPEKLRKHFDLMTSQKARRKPEQTAPVRRVFTKEDIDAEVRERTESARPMPQEIKDLFRKVPSDRS